MALTLPSQVIARNLDAVDASRVLVLDAPGGEIAPLLVGDGRADHVTLWQTGYADYVAAEVAVRALNREERARTRVVFGHRPDDTAEPFDVAIVYLPKGRQTLALLLHLTIPLLDASGSLFLVGPKRGGIGAGQAILAERFADVVKRDAARHCVLYSAGHVRSRLAAERETGRTVRRQLDEILQSHRLHYPCEVDDTRITVCSLPGVFSHGQVDDGTRMLLEALDGPPASPMLDFGCGSGVIGCWVARRWPNTEVDMVDVSALALAAARMTTAVNKVSIHGVWPSDVFSETRGSYATMVSNPPFHVGVRTDYRVVNSFLAEAAAHLRPGGTLRIVANRFLRYAPLLRQVFGNSRSVAESNRYRVYEARVADSG